MELQDFIKHFAEQFDDTDISEIISTTKFRELEEWSSLTALVIIAFVKTNYGKIITGAEIRSCETVQDLYDFIALK